MALIQLQVTDGSVPSDWWKKLVRHFVKTGDPLEIRCWKEESEIIRQASLYGTAAEDGFEISVKGTVTPGLLEELLAEGQLEKGLFQQATRYFTIHTQHASLHFWSEHYGTELYIDGASSDDISFVSSVISPYADCFSIHMEEI